MIRPAPGERRSRAVRLLLALLAVVALASCGAIAAAARTRNALRDAGYDVSNVTFNSTNGRSVVAVTWRPRATTTETLIEEEHGVARIVWTVAEFHIDALDLIESRISVPGFRASENQRISRDMLAQEFGPRPAVLDDKTLRDYVLTPGVIAGAVIALVVVVGGTVLIVVAVVRGRRKRRAWIGYPGPPPPGYPPQPGYSGYPPQPGYPPQSGYAPQPGQPGYPGPDDPFRPPQS